MPLPLVGCWKLAHVLLTFSPEGSTTRALPHTLLLSERPGNGKTFACRTWLPRSGKQVISIVLTPDTSAAELRGHWVCIKGGEFYFQKGPVVVAMEKGYRLVLDEVGNAGPDAGAFLLGALDSFELASIYLPTGEVIRPAPGYEVVATANSTPEELPPALRDRFTIIPIDCHNPELIQRLPADLRAMAEESGRHSDPNRYISLRRWFDFAELRSGRNLTRDEAALLAFGDRAREVLDGLDLGRSSYLPSEPSDF